MNTRSLFVLAFLLIGIAALGDGFLLFQGVLSGSSFAVILAVTLLLILAGAAMVRLTGTARVILVIVILAFVLLACENFLSNLDLGFGGGGSIEPTPTLTGEPTPSPTPTPVIIYVPVAVQAPSSNTSTIELVISLVSMTADVGSTLTSVIVLTQSRRRK